MLICETCSKECANESGLRLHARVHAAQNPAVKPESDWQKVNERQGFTLWRSGESGQLRNTDGKPLSGSLPFEKAQRAFDRFSTKR